MVELKIWHDIYKSLPEDGERVIVDHNGTEILAVWRRSITCWEPVGFRIYVRQVNPFASGNCRQWRRENFSSFNGNIKGGDMCMSNKDKQMMVYNVATAIIFGAIGFMIGDFPGLLIGVGVALLKKWKWK